MLVACITGPDFLSAKKQLEKAKHLCDAVEIRRDLIKGDLSQLKPSLPLIDCEQIPTYHNFDETPLDLDAIVHAMPKAKVVKIATMANCITDSLRMLDLVNRYQNIAGMCMGPYGEITRILAPVYGSRLTFVAVGPPAAPGQLQAEQLVKCYRYKQLSPHTKVYGLIGNPVSQSPSHLTHNAYFDRHGLDAVYVKMPVGSEELPLFFDLVKRLNFKGLSITTPYKEIVLDYVDYTEMRAKAIGAVNTLTFGEKVVGANTDGDGLLDVLEKRIVVKGKQLVILGSGGASKAIAYEARQRGGCVWVCSRRFGNLDQIPPYDVLINTIPAVVDHAGLNHNPIPKTVICDINFNCHPSTLIEKGRSRGCELIFGEEMFEAQAALQFLRWGQIPS